jgi:hypothetical protein
MDEEVLVGIKIPGAPMAVTTLESLTKANKALREERKKLDLQTDEGIARVKQINEQLDANTKTIKNNVSAIEKQRMNVGAYFEDIKKSIPFFSQAEKAQQALTVGVGGFGKALIATGIGVFVLALGALITYIKGSDEASDRFAKTLKTLGFIFDGLKLIVEKVGGFIFDTLEFIAGGIEKVVGFISPSLKAGIEAAKKAGEEIAKIEDDIDNRENELILKRAETNKKVFALREKAITQEGELKRKTIQEAIDLEKELSDNETELARMRLALFDKENAQRIEANSLSEEQQKERFTLIAAVTDAEATAFQATIKFQKEIEKLRDEDLKKLDEATKERIKLAQDEIEKKFEMEQEARRAQMDADQEARDALLALQEEQNAEDIQIEADQTEQVETIYDAATKRRMQNALMIAKQREQLMKQGLTAEQANAKIHQMIENQKLNVTSDALGQAAGLLKKHTVAYKVLATAQATINTYQAASNALKDYKYPIGAIFAALAIAQGLVQVANINNVKMKRGGVLYDRGGLSGTSVSRSGALLWGPSHDDGGIPFSVGGKVGFEAEGGEVIINKRSSAMFRNQLSAINQAGGGVKFATGNVIPSLTTSGISRASEASNVSRDMFNAISQIQPVVTVEDINAGQNKVHVIESKAQVLR